MIDVLDWIEAHPDHAFAIWVTFALGVHFMLRALRNER